MEKLRKGDPEKIGPYDLIARLGAGGMGVVFLGTRGVDRFAIKVVRSSFLDDPSLKTRFLREIETLKKVSSPYVARFLDSSIDEELAWHAVEFVNGPNLRELVDSKGPLSEADWWRLASQLKDGLESIHSLGIVHRDIKPSNIIMSESGMKLIDFGISQDSEATSLTTTGMVAGSPAWLSPEQLEGTDVSAASDLFSAGSVLTFAATGRSPWGQETSMSVPVVYQKILTGDISLEGISESQKSLITDLLHRDPIHRYFHGELKPNPRVVKETSSDPTNRERHVPPSNAVGSQLSLDEANEAFASRSALNGVSARPPQTAKKSVFVGLAAVLLGAFGWLMTSSWSNVAPRQESSSQSSSTPTGVPSLSNRWSECDLGQAAIDQAWRILEEGSTAEELTVLEDELDGLIGGANIGVSSESPNDAKRALYVVRTAVRLALSRGSFDAPSLNEVFADSNAIMMGLNAFRSTCGNPESGSKESTTPTSLSPDEETGLNDVSEATLTWRQETNSQSLVVVFEDAPDNSEVSLTTSDSWGRTNPFWVCPNLDFEFSDGSFAASCRAPVGTLNEDYAEQPSTLVISAGNDRKIAYVYFSRIADSRPTTLQLR